MAKGNDGNYLQHSVEVAIALHLAKLSTQGALYLALTHGMAPFEPCDAPLVGQSRGLLRTALEAAQSPPTPRRSSDYHGVSSDESIPGPLSQHGRTAGRNGRSRSALWWNR